MTDSTLANDAVRIDSEAAAWAAKRLSGDFTGSQRHEFERWLAADHRHSDAMAEYMEIAEISALAGAAAGLKQAANDEPHAKPTRRWLVAAPAIAASFFAMIAIVATRFEPDVKENTYVTARGETRDINLEDGTQISLNTNSALTVTYEKDRRHAVLKRGEAFFDVARDVSRPFVVDAADAQATVLGTSFTVRAKNDESIVCVHTGIVSVVPAEAVRTATPVRLTAGEQVAVAASGETSAVNRFEVEEAATWREGYLQFEETPLAAVIDDLNRYYEPQLEIADPSLGDAPVTGRFDINDQDVAIRALSVALSLKAEPRGTALIILSADD